MSEKDKIRSIGIAGNFEGIFKEYFKPLTYYSRKMVNDHDSAKEIVHTVFIKLWDKRDKIHLDSSLNFLRNNSKFYSGDFTELENRDELTENMHDQMVTAETEAKINSVIASLPDRCRQIFKMNRFEGLKYKEIAQTLGISVKTVEIQMSKALRILREDLKEYLDAFIIAILFFLLNSL